MHSEHTLRVGPTDATLVHMQHALTLNEGCVPWHAGCRRRARVSAFDARKLVLNNSTEFNSNSTRERASAARVASAPPRCEVQSGRVGIEARRSVGVAFRETRYSGSTRRGHSSYRPSRVYSCILTVFHGTEFGAF